MSEGLPKGDAVRLEPLSPANERAALAYLSGNPYVNVFVTYLVLFDISPATRLKVRVAYDSSGVCGAAYFGRQLALACEPVAIEAFAGEARRHRGERMIIGQRETIETFWEWVKRWHAQPRIVRKRQLVMTLEPEYLRVFPGSVRVRHARAEEYKDVMRASAELIAQELDYDPRRAGSDFALNIREMIERRLWWVGETDGGLCFFCNIGPWCRKTAQLQGIWCPPEFRGRGLATAAFGAICERLLEHSPTLSLYVNDFNRNAVALYERVGYRHVDDFQTMLF